jgi:hypothetical protein
MTPIKTHSAVAGVCMVCPLPLKACAVTVIPGRKPFVLCEECLQTFVKAITPPPKVGWRTQAKARLAV